MFIPYGDISVATIFPTDQLSDFIDIVLLSLLCRFLCFLWQAFHICLFVISDLYLDTPVGFCVCRSILHSDSGLSAVTYLLRQLAPLLDSLPRVSFFFLVFCISKQVLLLHKRCSSLASTVDLQCLRLHCLVRLCCSMLGTGSSGVGQRYF